MRQLLLLALFCLSACAGLPLDDSPDPATGTVGGASREAAEAGSRAGSAAAVQELVISSRSSRADGDYALALADIERAVRIEPRNSWLWIELGEIHLARGDPPQAAAMARKAMSIAGGDDAARAAAGRLLERASGY